MSCGSFNLCSELVLFSVRARTAARLLGCWDLGGLHVLVACRALSVVRLYRKRKGDVAGQTETPLRCLSGRSVHEQDEPAVRARWGWHHPSTRTQTVWSLTSYQARFSFLFASREHRHSVSVARRFRRSRHRRTTTPLLCSLTPAR